MFAIQQGKSSSASDPSLYILVVDSITGFLTDADSASFRILDISTPTKFVTPVEVVASTAIDINDAPAGHRLGTGRYAVTWAVPGSQATGTHQLEATVTYTNFDGAQITTTWTHNFEVIPANEVVVPGAYLTISDLRNEGISCQMLSDMMAVKRIQFATKLVEKYTGRFFSPRYTEFSFDGRSSRAVLLGHAIIAIEQVRIDISPFSPRDLPIDMQDLRAYNRHLTQGMLFPDDRDNPRVEFWHSSPELDDFAPFAFTRLFFPNGQQNVQIKGYFGYTDPSEGGSPLGETPELVKIATLMILKKYLPKVASSRFASDTTNVTSEKTRDQQITYANPLSTSNLRQGGFTGDSDIDSILAGFVRPIALGAV